jgi:hypothetical protein
VLRDPLEPEPEEPEVWAFEDAEEENETVDPYRLREIGIDDIFEDTNLYVEGMILPGNIGISFARRGRPSQDAHPKDVW